MLAATFLAILFVPLFFRVVTRSRKQLGTETQLPSERAAKL
jgi:hypothetical protein